MLKTRQTKLHTEQGQTVPKLKMTTFWDIIYICIYIKICLYIYMYVCDVKRTVFHKSYIPALYKPKYKQGYSCD